MSRLAIKKDVLRNLALKSKNQCAFPGCARSLINENNIFVGQVCHIEGANEGGERYNPDQTDEDRRSFDNLILFCYDHHKVTDDVAKYPVERLREIKVTHEKNDSIEVDEDKILNAIQNLENSQSKMYSLFANQLNKSISSNDNNNKGYKIRTPSQDEVWLPEQNKLYKEHLSNGTVVEYMMKDDLLCLTMIFKDGSEGYYELSENGGVKECKLPFPLHECNIIIPKDMEVRKEVYKMPNGDIVEKHILKYGRHITLVRDRYGKLVEADFQARLTVEHESKTIRILGRNDT